MTAAGDIPIARCCRPSSLSSGLILAQSSGWSLSITLVSQTITLSDAGCHPLAYLPICSSSCTIRSSSPWLPIVSSPYLHNEQKSASSGEAITILHA